MALNFPASPQDGDIYLNYAWDATKGYWKKISGPYYTISDVEPVSPFNGDIWFDSANGVFFFYYVDGDSGQWIEIGGAAGLQGEPGEGLPTGGTTGQYLRKLSDTDYDYEWQTIALTALSALSDVDTTGASDGNALIYDAATSTWVPGEGGSSFAVSDTAPIAPESGDVWYNSSTGKTYIYYVDVDSSQWVEIASTAVGYLETSQLADVSDSTPNDGDILVYNASSGQWEKQQPDVSLGLVIALG